MLRTMVMGGLVCASLIGCNAQPEQTEVVTQVVVRDIAPAPLAPEALSVKVLQRYPHDTGAFTQGLLWHEGKLYESTGLYRQSRLRRVEMKSGKVLQERKLDSELFGEGLARDKDRLIQLTWHEGRALVWSLPEMKQLKTLAYEGQGWGLCSNAQGLIMSDGSDVLVVRDPETFEIKRRIPITLRGKRISRLNELECVGTQVYANMWQRDQILRIDVQTGRVNAIIDAVGLLSADEKKQADVLNGIAYLPEKKRFAITGKRWPWLFEVEFVPKD